MGFHQATGVFAEGIGMNSTPSGPPSQLLVDRNWQRIRQPLGILPPPLSCSCPSDVNGGVAVKTAGVSGPINIKRINS